MTRRREYFSLEEANAILPTLEYYFRQLALVQRDLYAAQQALQAGGARAEGGGIILPSAAGEELPWWRDRYTELCHRYDRIMEEILAHGVEVIDPEAGIVHFYALYDGEEVVFSWQYGETAIQFWCDTGEPFHQRRPLRQLFADAPSALTPRH
ncbi:MAG: DUF2203 family protein [Deltaproteobacteria bacterium]|nr:DUF2203 family protein [Deltaproteobacteria bacterium]